MKKIVEKIEDLTDSCFLANKVGDVRGSEFALIRVVFLQVHSEAGTGEWVHRQGRL